jgi:hypothetical protein
MPLKVDSRDVSRLADRLEKLSSNYKRDSSRVLSTTQRGMKTEAGKSASAVYAVGRNRILKDVSVTNVNVSTLSFILRGFRKPITLMSYGAKQVAKGLSFRILKDGGRKLIRGGFIAKNLPFRRVSRKRLPIEAKFGPSVADMLNNPKVVAPLGAAFVTRATKELQRLIDRAFRG